MENDLGVLWCRIPRRRHVTSDYVRSDNLPPLKQGLSRGHGVCEKRSLSLGGVNTAIQGFLAEGYVPKLV